jgi:amino acid efflux transporter
MLLVTGCFTLVYVLGTAAAIRLLPPGWARRAAVVAFLAVSVLLVLTGPPALWSLAVAAGAVAYQVVAVRRSRSAKRRSPSSMVAGSAAPNPNTKPAVPVEVPVA